MYILGIESSCDDTSVALLDCSDDGFVVLAEKTAGQIEVHKKYGGVVPELAGRMHAENILPVIEEVMNEWRETNGDQNALPDVIAATTGPGLITGLLVGAEVAKNLSYLWNVPMTAMNHIEGHIHSVFVNNQSPISNLQFPALCLIVSGGHTELVLMKDFGDYTLLGKTRDDAAGEAFDKVGKLLGFEYPGGPKMSKHAVEGNTTAIKFPRPMLGSDDYDFSFAGLKTAALYWLRDNNVIPSEVEESHGIQRDLSTPQSSARDDVSLQDFCASFEQAVVDVLVEKTKRAAKKFSVKTIILGGGVSANPKLRTALEKMTEELPHFQLLVPSPGYSMDNGAMIAAAAYMRAKKKEFTPWQDIVVNPNWEVYDR
ncbi:MAG: tRNA (adenosine(37)-N6)-threonylcarbamoyltransferase complex transferase subunit TsaD [Candidatus Magasanikbacteria bacterium CG_4_9_14_0_2_um_filter_41_10]|uniref:tRNA N6-adenosine threonylcarbamoyltransferase n=1 Tax=Candidatus Magasanikbacteria bacterium CG_4_10_14_0_2_um_filter_41_31 TaxID=1974639 RepID=A0A2M7V424_9BACT|nr:MAG: tRNA (adenosine(37)-N6)-threonylcarbamoyltransferase complex transferase subunit TsaD [Candidatus Magasanikbacteria bacterium CG1_02_41_34]PIZ93275.1 MAG: tRNA (adenosine(37)-N6)-threonylcarbamoyltransferase complex transferase subunit TsaD [Candidatus Magasanikbacteria bacterium CG_4_10_14_0_2_um_filter_41_31]PJC53626.1 MAG: tRNA (adenosine(37)-N6)-threonylcarbamoyltransferase complex transferase subunit TsaD [Candidatus Magasanikbacteria bacterium CG_4_9_14_0_2_um_filter_41_10]